MARVTGIGGVFFKSTGDHAALAAWYQKHLGMSLESWGGAILNEGDLDIVRCSIHGNEADYAGAIFNRSAGADLEIFNSTISNNTAKRQHGGLVNNHFNFENNPSGGEVHLWHTTIGENKASGSGSLPLGRRSPSAPMPLVMPSAPTCVNTAPTSAPFSTSWGTTTWPPP